jgi:23S rRNA pseudouridine1911/1915/1917 synthase
VLDAKVHTAKLAKEFPRQMLHAWKLAFTHPRADKRMNFEAPLPSDFEQAMSTL